MRMLWKKAGKRTRVALILCLIALICSTVGFFFLQEELRFVTWTLLLIVWAINYWVIVEENIKLRKENYLKDYEIIELKYSYRGMGIYINSLDIEELKDIRLRIDNEIRDIDCKIEMRKEREK